MAKKKEENFLTETNEQIDQMNTAMGGEVLGSALMIIARLLARTNPVTNALFTLTNALTGLSSRFAEDPLIKQIESLIKQHLTTNVINQAQAQLDGLERNIREYERALNRWKENPNAETISGVVTYYRALNTHFNTTLAAFKQQNMDVVLLPMYAQAACCHLLFLREASIYGSEWRLQMNAENRGMDPSEVEYYYEQQLKYTREHTDYCVDTYKKGLNQLRVNNGAVDRWIEFNQLRRSLTISVLDLLPLFPTFCLKEYPTGIMSQLTREVYTDPHLNLDPRNRGTGLQFSHLESSLRPPHLSDFLLWVDVYTAEYPSQRGRYWGGHVIWSSVAGGLYPSSERVGFGNENYVEQVTTFAPIFNGDLIQVNQNHFYNERRYHGSNTNPGRTFSYRGISGVSFLYGDGSRSVYRENANQNGDSLHQLPPANINDVTGTFTHKVSNIRFVRSPDGSMNTSNYTRIPLFAWVHSSLTTENAISENVITQIPIAKMNHLEIGATMIENPGFCGGDIVRRDTNGMFGKFSVFIHPDVKILHYRIRIRYASTGNIQFIVNLGGNENRGNFAKTMNRGESLSQGKFITRSYTTAYEVAAGIITKTLQINVSNLSQGDSVYIDKVEIVPVSLGVPLLEIAEEKNSTE